MENLQEYFALMPYAYPQACAMRDTADYLSNRRRFGSMSDELLLRTWREAWELQPENVLEACHTQLILDLESELDARNLVAPRSELSAAINAKLAAMVVQIDALLAMLPVEGRAALAEIIKVRVKEELSPAAAVN